MWGYSLETLSWWANALLLCGFFFGGLAVVASSLSSFLSNTVADALQADNKKQIATANERIEEARLETAKALERAANAELQAAEANKKAEEERLARVKIEERLAPRSITQDETEDLAKRIRVHARMPVDILQLGQTAEISQFAQRLDQILRRAGWLPALSISMGGSPFAGVAVGVREDATQAEKAAAEALFSALNAQRIVTIKEQQAYKQEQFPAVVHGDGVVPNKAAIRLYVGTKP